MRVLSRGFIPAVIGLICVSSQIARAQCDTARLNYIVRDEAGKVIEPTAQPGFNVKVLARPDLKMSFMGQPDVKVPDGIAVLQDKAKVLEASGTCGFRHSPVRLNISRNGKTMKLMFDVSSYQSAEYLVDSLPFKPGTFLIQMPGPVGFFGADRWKELTEAEELYMDGLAHFRDREYPEAIDYFKRSVNSKADKQTFMLLGRSYLESHQSQEALLAFNQSLRLDPRSAWARWYIAQTYESLHQKREALYSYLEAMRVGPGDKAWDADQRAMAVESVGGAIVGLSRETTLELALPSFTERIKQTPKSAWSHSMLGQLYAAYGQNQEAYDALSEALRLSPNDNTWDKDQEAYTRSALARVTYPLRDAMELEAKRDIDSEKYTEAAALLEKVVRMTPNDNDAFALLGEARMKLKEYEVAIIALKKSIQLRASNSFAHGILGETYLAAGKNQEAAEAFAEARRLAPMEQRWYEGQKRALDALKKTPND